MRSLGEEDVIADSEETLALGADQARFVLLEKVRGLLETLAHKRPLVLVLEDLHVADSDTLHLLHYIARHIASLPMLVIGTFREAEARASSSTEPLWRTARDATVLRPDRLDETAIREYLAARGEPASASRVDELLETTSGNPLFLTELVEMLIRHQDGAPTRLPDSVQQVIRQHVSLLPAQTIEALSSASVIGRAFSLEHVGCPADAINPAVELGIIQSLGDDRYRFAHVLHRDVLYQDMSAADRSTLHLKYAGMLRERIEAGDEDHWSELAMHLMASGPEHRADAVAAWRSAAGRARKRLAFDDASKLLQEAVGALGEGPKFDPTDRATLLIECAEAMLQAGQIEEGRQICCDAFNIATALDDAQLMSAASLTYGKANVIGSVDRRHVDMLEQSLDALVDDDTAPRARVMGRLAAALQPAVDPSGPMKMARDAIDMARSTEDESVIYEVLLFAISALMDFAGPRRSGW